MGKTNKKKNVNKSNKTSKIHSVNRSEKKSKAPKKSVVLINNSKNVSKKKKRTRVNYTVNDVANALKAVDTGLSLRKAAAAYGVPIATLSRKKANPENLKQKTGPATVLSQAEEQRIVDWVLFRAQRGFPVTKTELLDSVEHYVISSKKETPFPDNRPSRHWYEGFRKRHPQLSSRKAQHLTISRATVSDEDIKAWYEEQKKYLTEKNLIDLPPARIFNCDETNVSLCPQSERVLLEKGSRSAYKVVESDKESYTVLFMYSASGDRAPLMQMFPYKEEIPEKIVKNCPEGWGIDLSDNGWMTSESFYEYITNIFYPWLIKQGTQFPIILYLDNHSSHMTLPLVEFCREKGIELIGLVPNSTHVMQPLDISFFHPFKDEWMKAVPRWKRSKGVTRIKKEDLSVVLKFALDSLTGEKQDVISGFKASGLYPFDGSVVDYNVLDKKKKTKSKVIEQKNQEELKEDKQKHLSTFESNLPKEYLEEFRSAWLNQTWPRDLQLRGLFEYWLDISEKSGYREKVKSFVREVTSVNIDLSKIRREEQSIEYLNNSQASTSKTCMNLNDHNHSSTQDFVPLIINSELKKESAPKIIYEIVVENNNPAEMISQPQSCTSDSENLNESELADVLTDRIPIQSFEDTRTESDNELIFDSNVVVINNQADSINTPVIADTTTTFTTPTINKFVEVKSSETFSQPILDKENDSITANTEVDTSAGNPFATAFRLPTNFLPKKKG